MLNRRADKLELLRIAEAVALEKSIDKELIISSMENGIAKAAKSKFGPENDIKVLIDRDSGEIGIYRKLIIVETDIGLFIESIFILPIAIVVFYFIFRNGVNDFSLANPKIMFFLFLAGPMTVIPLFLFIKGVEKCGLSASGMIFFITPTSQFLLGYFYYNEPFSTDKFISFILIWFAVLIYLRDLYENN